MFAQAYMGRKRRGAARPTLLLCGEKTAAKNEIPCVWSESIGRIRFRPMYAWANMGHPSRTNDRGWKVKSRQSAPTNLDKSEVRPSPFDKLGAGSAGLMLPLTAFFEPSQALGGS